MKNCNKDSDIGYVLEVDLQYPEELHELCNDLPFLTEIMKIEKVEELVANLHDKDEYVKNIRTLKQVLNHGLVLKNCIELLNSIKKPG